MSTATMPLLLRRGGLPICATETLAPTGSPIHDYVELDDIGGDEGFAEAVRLYWLLERVTFTPAGTATSLTGPPASPSPRAFSKTFRFPDPDAADLDISGINNSAMAVAVSGAGTRREPALRVCAPGTSLPGPLRIHDGGFNYLASGYGQSGELNLSLAYVSSRWRLYYFFNFGLGSGSPPLIHNPSSSGRPITVTTGTVAVGGYDLDWMATTSTSWDFTSPDLTATTDFWSF